MQAKQHSRRETAKYFGLFSTYGRRLLVNIGNRKSLHSLTTRGFHPVMEGGKARLSGNITSLTFLTDIRTRLRYNMSKKFGGVSYPKGTDLINRISLLMGILTLSRVGVYIPASPEIDTEAFTQVLLSGGGLMGYVDALTGGSISKVGLFSLGIVPYINASIIMQLMTSVIPKLKKLQRDEGPAGRQLFSQYQKVVTLILAIAQAVGQLNYLRPFVSDFNLFWLFENAVVLATGAMILTFLATEIDKLKLGNGTSLLIFANILSSIPYSLAVSLFQAATEDPKNLAIILGVFLATILGIVYVQEAERKIPINYASRYSGAVSGAIGRSSYLPFKVNATGVMPIIFASSLLALPATVSRFSDDDFTRKIALSLSPDSPLHIPYNVGLIFFFNYFYTFLQFEPNEVADNLKKSGASIPSVRPGKATAEYLEGTLVRMSVLGSTFLALLALAPSTIESTFALSALRGFGGTWVLILVGVATDFSRKLRAETLVEKYKEIDDLYT